MRQTLAIPSCRWRRQPPSFHRKKEIQMTKCNTETSPRVGFKCLQCSISSSSRKKGACCLAFLVLEVTLCNAGGATELSIHPALTVTYMIYWCNSSSNVIKVTNHFLKKKKLDLRLTAGDGTHTRHCQSGQDSEIRYILGLGEKPTTITLLKEHSSKMVLLTYCYTHRSVYHSILIRKAASPYSRW